MRVMVVDDEPLIARLVEVVLREPDIEVVSVGTLAAARAELARSDPYDAMLLDLSLPDGGGEELLEELRSPGVTSPKLIVFSALDPLRLRQIAERFGVAWLGKPFDNEALRLLLGVGAVAA